MKEPNFFIIGAPKSGTTALAEYLSEHPSVFMSSPKEPHHYNTDLKHGDFKDKAKYLSLFEGADSRKVLIGEASVWYLYSDNAIKNIMRDIPSAKFIVLLRNPVEMAPALHGQMLFSGFEDERDFNRAWDLQDMRARGKHIPKWCGEPRLLQYKDVCSLGKQMKRLYSEVPFDRVFPIIFDDFKKDPQTVWKELLAFLGLEDDGREKFPVRNAAQVRRSFLLIRFTFFYAWIRSLVGFKGFGTGLFSLMYKWNRRVVARPRLPLGVESRLRSEFDNDIFLLEKVLGRDLSSWRS